MSTVTTKEELKAAQSKGVDEIIVVGKLAGQLKLAKKVALLSTATLAALGVFLTTVTVTTTVTAPMTGGMSYLAAAPVVVPVAAMTGVEVAAIIAASFLGLALILAIYKDYEEISYESGRLVLRKKAKPAN